MFGAYRHRNALPSRDIGLRAHDPGVRGGLNNTAGYLQYRGIPIPHPPLISPHPTTGATVDPTRRASFIEGINRAGQLESTCDICSDVTQGSPVIGHGRARSYLPAIPHQLQWSRRPSQRRPVLRAVTRSRRWAAPAGSSCPIPGRARPCPPENPDVPAGAEALRQAERRAVFETVRPDPRGPLQVQARRNPRRRRPSAVGRHRHHEGSDARQLLAQQPDFETRIPQRQFCRSASRCR